MIRTIFKIMALLFVLTSCSQDWLELEPVDKKTLSSFYQTEDEMNMAVISVYDPLQWNATNFFGFEYFNFGMLSDILSDDCWSGGGNSSDRVGYLAAERGAANPSAGDFYALYKTCFYGISRANAVTERIGDVEEISDEAKVQFVGEAKFLRALYYFRLVRMWEKLPIMTTILTLEELEALPQADPQEVYDLIATDLWEAYNALPLSYDDTNLGRATKWAAAGLLMRVYLYYDGYKGGILMAGDVTLDKSEMIDLADSLIINSGHDLLPDINDLFASSNENNIETLFEVQFTENAQWGDWTNMSGQSGNMMVNYRGLRGIKEPYDDGWAYGPFTEQLSDEFEAADPRRLFAVLAPVEEKLSYTPAYQNTGFFCKKYQPLAADRGTSGEKRFNYNLNEVLIRYADVLLMAAELNLDVDAGKALTYLNQVRTRAMGPGAALVAIDLDAIYHERRVELAGEGHRYWDLLRRGLDYAETHINGTNEDGSDEFKSEFNRASKGLMPIPQNELDLMTSAGWVQNDGYTY